MIDFTLKDTRLDEWGNRKKDINKKLAPTHKPDGTVKFRIQPYSIWWFDIGENIGTETSCHFSQNDISYLRPCIIISTNNFNNGSYQKKLS